MKLFTCLLLAFTLFSNCNNSKAKGEFEYIIIGNVSDREGIQVSLIPEGSDIGERLTTSIEGGKFVFEGKSKFIQPAALRFEGDIKKMSHSYSTSTILLEPGKTEINLDIEEREFGYMFSMPIFVSGDYNIELWNFYIDFEGSTKGGSRVYGDSIKNDSMIKNVYPKSRINALDILEDQFINGSQEVSTFVFERIIIDRLHGNGMFDKDNLDIESQTAIKILFSKIDSTQLSDDKYDVISDAIYKLERSNSSRDFYDFVAFDSKTKKYRISDLISRQKYTVLVFWFTECVPCRKFNREIKSHYSYLQSRGVGIISVNIDEASEKWKKSSLEDEIEWTNLYVGSESDLELRYEIRGFPFKLIFDSKYDNANVKLNSSADLIDWVDQLN